MMFLVRLCLSLSYLLQHGFFLIHSMGRSCLASFRVLSEGIVPYVAVDLVCLWFKVNSGFLLYLQLELEPLHTFIYLFICH